MSLLLVRKGVLNWYHVGFWTLAVGRLFGVETLTLNKLIAVCTSFLGVLLVSLPDLTGNSTSATGSHDLPYAALGNLLSLGSSMLYALYVTILKVRTGSEDRLNTQLFFGFVGLYVLLGMWPIGVVLHLMGIESMEFPPNEGGAWAALLISVRYLSPSTLSSLTKYLPADVHHLVIELPLRPRAPPNHAARCDHRSITHDSLLHIRRLLARASSWAPDSIGGSTCIGRVWDPK